MEGASDRGRPLVVIVLGATQTLAWASSYYLPAVLVDPITTDLGISRSWFFAAFSASLLLSGLLGPLAGRAIDSHGGRSVLASSNLVFAIGLLILARASGLVGLVVAWAVLGVGMAGGLYDAAFAFLAGLYRDKARGSITGITLIAGFASTIGWPTTTLLTHALGWRGACEVWAVLHLLVGLPANQLLLPAASRRDRAAGAITTGDQAPRTMVILAGVFAATTFIAAAMATHLPRLLQALGATPEAAVAAGALIGPAQVGARLIELGLIRRMPPLASARLATALHPLGAVLVSLLGAPLAAVFAVLHGAGNGMLTISKGVLPLALFGSAGYGLRTGVISAPGRVAQSAAPLLYGLVLDDGGPSVALGLSCMLSIGSLAALCVLKETRTRPDALGQHPIWGVKRLSDARQPIDPHGRFNEPESDRTR